MDGNHETVERYYARGSLLEAILGALVAAGKDPEHLSPDDLAPVDAFHIRGREATVELARRAALTADLQVLDVGAGLGGSARYLAAEYQCRVTGIDLTREYVDVAGDLVRRVGLDGRVDFVQASALDLPFAGESFDVVWTEHVQMNIADKARFYGEISRVLKPGGQLLFHDVFQGPAGEPHFPVPWAEDASISHLATPEQARHIIEASGFEIRDWENTSARSLEWFVRAAQRLQSGSAPPLGIGLLMGPTAKDKFANIVRNLREERIIVLQAVAKKSARAGAGAGEG